jgi:hypothetical protein
MDAIELLGSMGVKEAQIVEKTDSYVGIMVKIPYGPNMLLTEENIQQSMNEAGKLATESALSQYDTDGSPITVAKMRYTSKGLSPKYYQTPYGEVYLQRHVYQHYSGGCTYCPLDRDADIIVSSTPKFAKMVGSKYSRNASSDVQKDLLENHNRHVSRSYIQNLSDSVGVAVASRPNWTYAIPVDPRDVLTIAISLDGTCMLLCLEGWRQAMVGSISLYNSDGDRLYTRYTSFPPEYGKSRFHEAFTRDIQSVKRLYPHAKYIGVADGAADNWTFLQEHTQLQVLDFFHACEYLSRVSKAAFKRPFEGNAWFEKSRHTLKKEELGAKEIFGEMKLLLKKRISNSKKEIIESAITYFSNQMERMNYQEYRKDKIPIGSGVIEAACKVIIKQRMCQSGMKWTDEGAKSVLALRCLNESDSMWEQFWKKRAKGGGKKH